MSSNSYLSTVTISFLQSTGSVEISGNTALVSVALPNLEQVFGNFVFRGNVLLSQLVLTSLHSIGGIFVLQSTALSTFNAPSLAFILGSGHSSTVGFQIGSNPQLESLNVPDLVSYGDGAFQICLNGPSFEIPTSFQSLWSGQSLSLIHI